jgi:hypothetical protein
MIDAELQRAMSNAMSKPVKVLTYQGTLDERESMKQH